jgi:hypothetical protein
MIVTVLIIVNAFQVSVQLIILANHLVLNPSLVYSPMDVTVKLMQNVNPHIAQIVIFVNLNVLTPVLIYNML